MKLPTAILALGLCAAASAVSAEPRGVSVAEALELAHGASPVLARARAALSLADAGLVTAKTYPFNPVLELGGGRRQGADGDATDRSAAVTQEIRLRGRRRSRVEVAEAAVDSARRAQERQHRLLSAQVLTAFARAALARDLVDVARSDLAVAEDFARIAERRLEAGATSELETNLARAGLARAAAGLARAEAAYGEAQALLGESVALEGEPVLMPRGELPPPRAPRFSLEESLAAAEARRADLASLMTTVATAEGRLRLARAERLPNPSVSAFTAREEGDEILGLRLAMPLPLFQRNQGEIATAEAELAARRAEADAGLLRVHREVAAAHSRLRAATEAARFLQAELVSNLEDSLRLAEGSFEAGKIGSSELLLAQRELVEARRLALEARGEAWIAGVTLALAMGEDPAALADPEEEARP